MSAGHLDSPAEQGPKWALAVIGEESGWRMAIAVAGLSLLAWSNRFMMDDSFITLRYARNLSRGNGLVWNPGENIEGYTNFLWTLIMAIPFELGWDPIVTGQVLGVALFAGSLFATHRLSSALFANPRVALWSVLLLGANYSFSSYATGGLETQLQAFLWVSCAATVVSAERTGGLRAGTAALLSIGFAAALMTRLDSALWIAPIGLAALAQCIGSHAIRTSRRALVLLLLPGAVILAAWFTWKWSFYGDLVPNTFYAKVTSSPSILRGGYYVLVFFLTYLLLPIAALYAYRLRSLWRRIGATSWVVLNLPLAIWFLYVISVGGDFMEFRFIVPALPALFCGLCWGLDPGDKLVGRAITEDGESVSAVEESSVPRWVRPAGLGLALAGSLLHAYTFDSSPLLRGMESLPQLVRHIDGPPPTWVDLGVAFDEYFSPSDDILIAVAPAGAIPYYSEHRYIDMLGLNDRWIAKNGYKLSDRPGHQRIASTPYLIERQVHLIVGNPWVGRSSDRPAAYTVEDLDPIYVHQPMPDPDALPSQTRIVAIPLAGERELLAIYLTPHPRIDAYISSGEWPSIPLLTEHRDP